MLAGLLTSTGMFSAENGEGFLSTYNVRARGMLVLWHMV